MSRPYAIDPIKLAEGLGLTPCREERSMNVEYQLKGDTVVIRDGFHEPIILNLESVKLAIETIKAKRSDYTTAAAHKCHLSTYEGALTFLEAKLKST